jgi:hypothetical protein
LAEVSARLRNVLEMAKGNPLLAISGDVLESLPAEMFELTHLEDILLGDNQLPSLPPEIGKLTTSRPSGSPVTSSRPCPPRSASSPISSNSCSSTTN